MNLAEIMNLKDIYTSPEIAIPLVADGTINKVSWDAETSSLNSLLVQSCYSDYGYQWSDWEACTNGSQIPGFNIDTPINHVLIKFRVIMQTKTQSDVPKLISVNFEFEPVLIFDNKGDTYCLPEIWIKKLGSGDFSLINIADSSKEFKFSGLMNNETVYVNNERHHIESSIAMKVLNYESFNEKYLKLPYGKNFFRVVGNANITFRHQFKFI